MGFLPTLVTVEPAEEPLTVAEAREQCLIDDAEFDGSLSGFIAAARQHVEAWTGLKLVTQTVVMRADSFKVLARLPVAPIASVSSVTYLDSDGVEQTLSTDVYETVLIGQAPTIRLKLDQAWPSYRPVSDAVRVTAVAGYGLAAAVPDDIKQAMRLLIGDWFQNREDTMVNPGRSQDILPIPNGANLLLRKYRIF